MRGGFGHFVTALMRMAGVHNIGTLHFSNFAVGIGIIGVTDHFLNVMYPGHRTRALLTTAVLFTLYNAGFELAPSRPDWGDFISGQAGLALYLIINSYVEYRLKGEPEGVPHNLPIRKRVRRLLFPLNSR